MPSFLACDDLGVDVATFERLLAPAGQEVLAAATQAADDDTGGLAANLLLRQSYPADLVVAALHQSDLRRRATTKFGQLAARLYFTRPGLEQATSMPVAAHRARRMRAEGVTSLLDLTCGVGADLLAAADGGLTVTAVDQDPLTAAIARANLAALGFSGSVSVGDAVEQPRADYGIVFADPSRRGERGRTFDPNSYSPPWQFVENLLDETAAVKVAPGISHALVPPSVEAEWVSLDGRLREACLWSGQMSRTSRRATVLSSGGESSSLTGTSDRAAGGEVRPLTDPGHYVYEPDDAVVRAHLVTAFAALVDGWLLHPQVAYVSADRLVSTALGTAFEVVDVLPFKEKPLRAALRARGVGSLTIKKRGVAVSPEGLRDRLRLHGPNAATVILARTAGSAVALLVDPVANRPLPPNPAAPLA